MPNCAALHIFIYFSFYIFLFLNLHLVVLKKQNNFFQEDVKHHPIHIPNILGIRTINLVPDNPMFCCEHASTISAANNAEGCIHIKGKFLYIMHIFCLEILLPLSWVKLFHNINSKFSCCISNLCIWFLQPGHFHFRSFSIFKVIARVFFA